jgi:deoxyadenosine/deoxycytidine kinase
MIIVLNGPLGIGKSTLAGPLSESIQQCVMLSGAITSCGMGDFTELTR